MLVVPTLTAAGEKEFLDQFQPNSNGEYKSVDENQMLAQTFQPDVKGLLSHIVIKLDKNIGQTIDNDPLPPNDLIVEIRTTCSYELPTEEVIAVETVSESMIESDNPQLYEVFFQDLPFLDKKSTYAIVLRVAEDQSGAAEGTPGAYHLISILVIILILMKVECKWGRFLMLQ